MAHETKRKKLKSPEAGELVSSGPSVITEGMEGVDNLNDLKTAFLQAGVVEASDWSFTATINATTGALGSEAATGGKAFLPDPVVEHDLMPSVTTNAILSGLAPTLPALSKYVSVAYELTPSTWGASAAVSLHTGVEKATQAEAEAAPPATTAGKIQVRRVIVFNNAGKYEIKAQTDVRPWATGGGAPETVATGKLGAEAVTDAKIAKGTITGDKLAVNGEKYGVQTGRKAGEAYECSATHPVLVILEAHLPAGHANKAYGFVVTVNTFEIGKINGVSNSEGAEVSQTITFLVPAGQKWEISSLKESTEMYTTYLVL